MKNNLYIYLFLLEIITVNAQQLNFEANITRLNQQIQIREGKILNDPDRKYHSFPQTIAHSFKLVTENPEKLISRMHQIDNFELLLKEYPNLEVDFKLLLVRNTYTNYKEEKIIKFWTYQIGNNRAHGISLPFEEKWNKNNIKFVYRIYRTNKYREKTFINGFFLLENFKVINLPKKYTNYINYVDKIIEPEFNLFTSKRNSNSFGYQIIPEIDSLTKYYERVTAKPKYNKKEYKAYKLANDVWINKRTYFADSLYQNDSVFKKRLQLALDYALQKKVSNRDLEFFIGQLVSKPTALKLIRENPQVGTCSFDSSPRIQLIEMVKLASEISNWNIFIKASMSLLNDYASRDANSNIATNSRSTYINELEKLDLDIPKLLIGSSIRLSNSRRGHFNSVGNKIGQAFANTSDKNKVVFEKEVNNLITNKNIDFFNKLHFYNIYRHYQYFTTDSLQQQRIKNNINKLTDSLPYSISSRIKNPNKQLQNLLIRERELINNYEIKESTVADIISTMFNGHCWQTTLREKGSQNNIWFSLTMSLEDSITPFSSFLIKKDKMLQRVNNHNFLMKLQKNGDINGIYINFINNQSFVDYKKELIEDFPKELLSQINFNNSLHLYTKMEKGGHIKWILTQNNTLILLKIYKGLTLQNYSFKDLVTRTEEAFFGKTYYSYRGFDINGKIIF